LVQGEQTHSRLVKSSTKAIILHSIQVAEHFLNDAPPNKTLHGNPACQRLSNLPAFLGFAIKITAVHPCSMAAYLADSKALDGRTYGGEAGTTQFRSFRPGLPVRQHFSRRLSSSPPVHLHIHEPPEPPLLKSEKTGQVMVHGNSGKRFFRLLLRTILQARLRPGRSRGPRMATSKLSPD
jgi:hypothetical protein